MALGHEAARAVGVALATNPWPLIVPCHRVVSAGDKMTGFSAPGGVRTKTRRLTLDAGGAVKKPPVSILCHSERSEESISMCASEYPDGFFTSFRMTNRFKTVF